MSSPGSMTRWAVDLGSTDPKVREDAARRIWGRYESRLRVLVRRNLDVRVRRREGESDVLQDMFRNFCDKGRMRTQPVRNREHLWRLLVLITLSRVKNAAKKHAAARRDYRLEVGDVGSMPPWVIEHMGRSGPMPGEAMILKEELDRWLDLLNDEQRKIAEWKMDGYTNKEIGVLLDRTERSVELKLRRIRERLETRLATLEADGEA